MTLHRTDPSQDWQEVSVVCALPMGWVLLQENGGQALPGRFAALASSLRVVVGEWCPDRRIKT